MIIDIPMPRLGESIAEGTVARWRVRAGDTVAREAPLVEVATDKADTEVLSPSDGRVVEILAAEGNVVPVGAPLCRMEDAAAAAEPIRASEDRRGPAPRPATDLAGRAPSGAVAGPAARRKARELGVDLERVRGSGARGRITSSDVVRAATPERVPAVAPPPPAATRAPSDAVLSATPTRQSLPTPGVGFGAFKVPPYVPAERDTIVPFTRRRRITADHMTYSKVVSPHVMTVAEVDLFRVTALRASHKERYAREGSPLTALAFIAHASVRALREHPQLNARVIDDAVALLGDIHLGIAVESAEGLVVPVLRNAGALDLLGIARGIDDLAKRARSGRLTPDDLRGATFSLSNPGAKGNLFGGAVINQPNAGILRMGEIQKRAVVVEGAAGDDVIAIHPVMYMALSYDHRVVDGVAANAFLYRVTELLEAGAFEL